MSRGLEAARAWLEWFATWYNTQHRNSGIRFVTPDQRHRRTDQAIVEKCKGVYMAAKARDPERWRGKMRSWSYIDVVRLKPSPTSA